MDTNLFFNAFVYLLAAMVAAPLGKRFGVGAVLGYLIVGALIGPSAFGFIGQHQEEILHFAEFGVVLMLFVIGLELNLNRLWKMRTSIFGLGGLQVGLSALILGAVGLIVVDDWREALALGLILALSSTAIVVQTLKERGLAETSAGRQGFAVLLFQDIAVIPILAILPLLASRTIEKDDSHGHEASGLSLWVEQLPSWGFGLVLLAAIGIIIVAGRFLITPWLRWVAKLKVPEALNATTLAMVIGVALLMNSIGLSPALGTFIAGVMLASSEFRHELEGNIEPFKSLLLAVFFLAVGASINFTLIADQPLTIALWVAALIALKALVLWGLAYCFRLAFDQRLLFAICLAQGGEFAFVLGGFAVTNGVLGEETAAIMIASVALTMALSPLLLIALQRLILPRLGTHQSIQPERPSDVVNDHGQIILVGFGRFGHPIVRLLRSVGYAPTVLEKDSDHVDFLRKIGLTCYYGDATRSELLHAAGAEEAELIIIAVDDEEDCVEIIETCQKLFPNLRILARACSRDHAYRLHELEVQHFVEQLGSSLDCAISALGHLGHDPDHAKDAARRFKEREVRSIGDLSKVRSDEKSYLSAAQSNLQDLDSLLVNAPIKEVGRAGKAEKAQERKDG